ncbi:hypothetical protein GOARA_046_00100 [Gordonia araii NBRC 100433]|uniref:Uncharacterized protein n=1 Tax=Gordonia araii NBRC 100433 TaxID=1073574 RepID=G7H1L6_9ACTN|nr:hypothetical protein [Gordonia araii]NNG98268.1 hypothetical protein [Gordonia araii NBRC 100433]GAB09741.1 hypothetical protein GOARA_046_00100 [Gordonia araii NBRC 100433]
MGHVMGIAVVDRQIASVVRDDNDAVVATNTVDVADETVATVTATVNDLVGSAPFEVTQIGLVAADPALVDELRRAFEPFPSRPAWYSSLTVDALDSAMVELARTDPALRTAGGQVALVNLDDYTAPTAGIPIIAVDPHSGVITGRTEWHPDFNQPTAVIDPSGAANVAGAISSMPGSETITHVVFTGTGADVPGVHAAFEGALGRPVVVAAQPRYAIAGAAASLARGGAVAPVGAPAAFAASPSAPYGGSDEYTTAVVNPAAHDSPTVVATADRANRRRWWLIGGTAAAGFLILAGAIAAVLFSTGTAQRVVGVTTVSVSTETRTATVTRTETRSDTTVRTTTVTPPTRTVTKTTTRPPSTITETETETVTEAPGSEEDEGF